MDRKHVIVKKILVFSLVIAMVFGLMPMGAFEKEAWAGALHSGNRHRWNNVLCIG